MIAGFRHPDKPIECSPDFVNTLPEKDWVAQAKYDGWRLQIYVDGPGHVRCLTRVGKPILETSAQFDPQLTESLEQMNLPMNTVIDAEFVGPRGKLPNAIYIFDMLAWDGRWLVNEPYAQRWERCRQLPLSDPRIHLAATVESNFLDLFNRLKSEWDQTSISLCEGIVLKSRNGKLKLNRNRSQKSDVMLKVKYREIKDKRW